MTVWAIQWVEESDMCVIGSVDGWNGWVCEPTNAWKWPWLCLCSTALLNVTRKCSSYCALFAGVTGVSTVTSAERQSICTTPWSLHTRRPCSHIWRTLTALCPYHSQIAPLPAPRRVSSKSFSATTSCFKQLQIAPLNWREPSCSVVFTLPCLIWSSFGLNTWLLQNITSFSWHCIEKLDSNH